eukprot:6050125-Amphidinium_carterae.1
MDDVFEIFLGKGPTSYKATKLRRSLTFTVADASIQRLESHVVALAQVKPPRELHASNIVSALASYPQSQSRGCTICAHLFQPSNKSFCKHAAWLYLPACALSLKRLLARISSKPPQRAPLPKQFRSLPDMGFKPAIWMRLRTGPGACHFRCCAA